jgi:hypothetical protein
VILRILNAAWRLIGSYHTANALGDVKVKVLWDSGTAKAK